MKRSIAVFASMMVIMLIGSVACAEYVVVKDTKGKCQIKKQKKGKETHGDVVAGPFKTHGEAKEAKAKRCPSSRRTSTKTKTKTEYVVVKDEQGKCKVIKAKDLTGDKIAGPFETRKEALEEMKKSCSSDTDEH